MNKSFISILILLLYFNIAYGQITNPKFASYLSDKELYNDIILLSKNKTEHLDNHQLDSLEFYTGWAFYNAQELEKSINSFMNVGFESNFYLQSRFLTIWSEYYLGNTRKGLTILEQCKPESIDENELLLMFQTGGSLMLREMDKAENLLKLSNTKKNKYSKQWDRMELHYTKIDRFNPKSYTMAGILSGIIPGAGKIYAGQKGAGTSSLLLVGALAAITLENGFKKGWTKWNTITSASFLSVFYVGNIYGSIVSVKIYRDRFYDEVDRAILLDLNIPLRDIYRK